MPFLDGKTPVPREDTTLHSVAWVALPIIMMLFTITALLFINQKKQWIPVLCYRTPTKVGGAITHIYSMPCWFLYCFVVFVI